MAALDDLEAALERGDHAQALTHALAAWQHVRDPRTAALIDRLSKKLAATRPRPTGKSVRAKQEAWLVLAANNDPSDIDALLVTLADIKKAKPLEARLAQLRGRIDPRIATAMHAFLVHPPVPGSTGIRAVEIALELVVAIADPRSEAAFEVLAGHIAGHGGGMATWDMRKRLPFARTRLGEQLERLGPAVEDTAALDRIERRLAEQESTHATQNPDELFAAVYANPLDDQARSVLADLLQERGDPRGELIALQLARAAGGKRTKRESELLGLHAREWLGPIEPLVLKSNLVYERGFLMRCAVRFEGIAGAEDLMGLPQWRTVTEVEVGVWNQIEKLVAGMPVLRTLRGVSFSSAVPSHPTVENLGLEILESVPALLAAKLPSLRELEVESCHRTLDEMKPFLDSPMCARLRLFRVNAYPIDQWIPAMAKLGLPRVGIAYRSSYPWRLWFEPGEVRVQYIWTKPTTTRDPHELTQMLEHVPDPAQRRVSIDTKVVVDDPLAAVLARFSGHRIAE